MVNLPSQNASTEGERGLAQRNFNAVKIVFPIFSLNNIKFLCECHARGSFIAGLFHSILIDSFRFPTDNCTIGSWVTICATMCSWRYGRSRVSTPINYTMIFVIVLVVTGYLVGFLHFTNAFVTVTEIAPKVRYFMGNFPFNSLFAIKFSSSTCLIQFVHWNECALLLATTQVHPKLTHSLGRGDSAHFLHPRAKFHFISSCVHCYG